MIKNIKNGFTLAETLIAMAIVGVIAALTIPTVVSETQNGKLAASLGRNVEAIETGCQLIVQRASEASTNNSDGIINGIFMVNTNVNGVASADTNRLVHENLFSANASESFNTVPLTSTQTTNYASEVRDINGNNPSSGPNDLADNFAISSKLGAYYGYKGNNANTNEIDPIIGYIYIDVNAQKTPNRYGRDIFLFGLTDSCHMVPAGTTRVNSFRDIPIESDGCGNSPTSGLSCTLRVVKNGYKIDY